MIQKEFTTTIMVDNTAEEVFAAINNVSGWWQGEIEGKADAVDDEFVYRMKHFHYSRQKVIELVPGKKVVWLVTDSQLTFTNRQEEWTGTQLIFEMDEVNGKTTLHFTHRGLTPGCDCYSACTNGWSQLIQKSLHSLITTGKGQDVF